MKDKYFLDTNLIVYTFDKNAHDKRNIAQTLLKQALHTRQGCISWQVIQEFINVVRRKFNVELNTSDCQLYLKEALDPICEIFPNIALYHTAIEISQRWQYRFYDALIIAAALKAECHILYSEDLHHGQKIESLYIINPFIQK